MIQFNFHRRTGLRPGFGITLEKYSGTMRILVGRIGWSALTLTWGRSVKR